MQSYLRRGVKEVIEERPAIGEVLERHGIGCVQCSVGTCLLGDVVEIHGLTPEQERALMADLDRAVAAGGDAPSAVEPEPVPRPARKVAYSPPVRRLVDEHVLIKRLLSLLPAALEEARASRTIDRLLFEKAFDFIRGYADRFHHLKEEDILFDYTDREAEIVRVILQDHDRARGLVRAAAQALEEGDVEALCENLTAYRELLTEHITKEDEVLYPHIDRQLTVHQVGEIARRSEQAEAREGSDVPARYERFIEQMERRCRRKEEEPCLTPTQDVLARG